MISADDGPGAAAARGHAPGRTERNARALLFVSEMYAVQLDQLARILQVTERGAASAVARWRAAGLAESERLSPGSRWIWLTRAGLGACGSPHPASRPGLSRLAHIRAVTEIRLALSASPLYLAGGGYWRGERRLRARIGGRLGLREHVPDAEVHWPDGTPVAWAGECWAIEAELTPKTLTRTVAIMRELLTRTGDYGCPAAQAHVPGHPARHARAIYLCAPAARPVVARARDSLGQLGARIEIRSLPALACWPGQDGRPRQAGTHGRGAASSAAPPDAGRAAVAGSPVMAGPAAVRHGSGSRTDAAAGTGPGRDTPAAVP